MSAMAADGEFFRLLEDELGANDTLGAQRSHRLVADQSMVRLLDAAVLLTQALATVATVAGDHLAVRRDRLAGGAPAEAPPPAPAAAQVRETPTERRVIQVER
jgi:hypothetical protein